MYRSEHTLSDKRPVLVAGISWRILVRKSEYLQLIHKRPFGTPCPHVYACKCCDEQANGADRRHREGTGSVFREVLRRRNRLRTLPSKVCITHRFTTKSKIGHAVNSSFPADDVKLAGTGPKSISYRSPRTYQDLMTREVLHADEGVTSLEEPGKKAQSRVICGFTERAKAARPIVLYDQPDRRQVRQSIEHFRVPSHRWVYRIPQSPRWDYECGVYGACEA